MNRSSINFLTIFFSFILIIIISTLLIFTYFDINEKKDESLKDFMSLKSNLLNIDILTFTSKMNDLYKGMPELSAFRITDKLNSPIYYYSIPDFESKLNDKDFFKPRYSVFYSYFYQTIQISNHDYNIEAVFNIYSKNNVYYLFKKISLILITYFIILFSLLLYIYFNKKNTNIINSTVSNKSDEKIDFNITNQKITDELKKSASFDHDIVLILIGAPGSFIKENEVEFLNFLKKHFIFQDLIFRYNENIFGLLLPNMDLEKGIKKIEIFDQTFVNSGSSSLKFPIMFGLSSRNGRLISGNIILKEARAALSKAMSDKNYQIIGFRPNPARYREYLSKIKTK